jgi:hypothetical protein
VAVEHERVAVQLGRDARSWFSSQKSAAGECQDKMRLVDSGNGVQGGEKRLTAEDGSRACLAASKQDVRATFDRKWSEKDCAVTERSVDEKKDP